MALEEPVPPDVTALDGLVLAVLAKEVVDDVEDLLVPLEVVVELLVEELTEVVLLLTVFKAAVFAAAAAAAVFAAAAAAAVFAAAAAAAALAAACCWASKAAAEAFWAAVSVTANALEPIAPMKATSNAADINEIGLMIAPSAN
ncbi:hypothetical protein G6725_03915 [Polynucleobacter paneuropaeus]|nr:hypothetical protein [Polynucleobacter paneuropaeus]MBT8593338.1 hypothetical protein [Polynucleobacter paneuropaeus]QWD01238.1 hypothetical protein G6726_04445 [Polynucleobacter paneuropaeus]QWD24149.1 hypothetical protein G6687_04405 [Polynucleobacter paneuropaeus]QWD29293.1 hypothetical protein G6682_04405 [Polynucleobacter paneuropaeus]